MMNIQINTCSMIPLTTPASTTEVVVPHDSWFYTPMPAWLGILAPVLVFLLTILLNERKELIRRVMNRIGVVVQLIRIRDSLAIEVDAVKKNLEFMKSLGQGNFGGMAPSLHIEQYNKYPTEWLEDVLCVYIEPITSANKNQLKKQVKNPDPLINVTENYTVKIGNLTMESRVQDFHFITGIIISAQQIYEERKRLIPEMNKRITEFHENLTKLMVDSMLWINEASHPEKRKERLEQWSSDFLVLFNEMKTCTDTREELSFKDFLERFLDRGVNIIVNLFTKSQIDANPHFVKFIELTNQYKYQLALYSDYISKYISSFENHGRLYTKYQIYFANYIDKQLQFDIIRNWYLFVKKPKRN